MIDQLYADTLSELEKALAGWNDASVIANELLRQRNEALQLARELRDALSEIEWSNDTEWQRDRAHSALTKANQILQ